MKAVILAAGVGSRMGALTSNTPKCLLLVGEKTILAHQLAALHANRVRDVSVVLGHCAEDVRRRVPSGVTYFTNPNYAQTGMLESLYCARSVLNDDVVVLYGDLVLTSDALAKLVASEAEVSVLATAFDLSNAPRPEAAHEVYHGQRMRKGRTYVRVQGTEVCAISKELPQPQGALEAVGALKLRRDIAEQVVQRIAELTESGEIAKFPSPSYLFQALLAEGVSIHAVEVEESEIAEIDYPADLEAARRQFNR